MYLLYTALTFGMQPFQSAAIDSSPEEIEMASNYVSKKQRTLFTA
jgi:hypothetical protein